MKRIYVLLVTLTLLVVAAPAVFAQEDPGAKRGLQPFQQNVQDPCPTYDSCSMASGSGSAVFSNIYDTCTASGTNGCAACGIDAGTSMPRCFIKVHYSASCQCELTYPAPSYNTVCKGSGKCTYRY